MIGPNNFLHPSRPPCCWNFQVLLVYCPKFQAVLAYISLLNTCKSVGFWPQTLTVALLLLYIVHIPVAPHSDTQVDVPDSTVQPCGTELHIFVALIHEYVPSVRHSATVSTQGKQKYFVVGGPGFGSWQVQEINHFFQSAQTSSVVHASSY
jgi:hypothetical protein